MMRRADDVRAPRHETIHLAGRRVEYRVVLSKTARKLRVRVGPGGVEVVQPAGREDGEIEAFVRANGEWVVRQLDRVERLRRVRKPERISGGEIVFRGVPTAVRLETHPHRRGPNQVAHEAGQLIIVLGSSPTPPHKSLENWLRRQARAEIQSYLAEATRRLKCHPGKVYIMGQRTKWGNCSPTQNLSFNWRLILAPPFVLRYLVTHEAVHLAVPDHSALFWLTVQSLCPETERARQWLAANGHRLQIELATVCRPAPVSGHGPGEELDGQHLSHRRRAPRSPGVPASQSPLPSGSSALRSGLEGQENSC